MLSEYNSSDQLFRGQTCLVPNLHDKSRYILHIRNLKLYTDLGMKVDRIHKVLEFDQKAFLVPYIAFNIEKRLMARSSFEKKISNSCLMQCTGKQSSSCEIESK